MKLGTDKCEGPIRLLFQTAWRDQLAMITPRYPFLLGVNAPFKALCLVS